MDNILHSISYLPAISTITIRFIEVVIVIYTNVPFYFSWVYVITFHICAIRIYFQDSCSGSKSRVIKFLSLTFERKVPESLICSTKLSLIRQFFSFKSGVKLNEFLILVKLKNGVKLNEFLFYLIQTTVKINVQWTNLNLMEKNMMCFNFVGKIRKDQALMSTSIIKLFIWYN